MVHTGTHISGCLFKCQYQVKIDKEKLNVAMFPNTRVLESITLHRSNV